MDADTSIPVCTTTTARCRDAHAAGGRQWRRHHGHLWQGDLHPVGRCFRSRTRGEARHGAGHQL